ncbi:glycosyltransferase family 39 protein [uncultured Methanolobus sp.]|uniref:ArnT family glycosyltransferase n=1 Tax=uncultured Methanolobus sp. TaxID=218300 RepID=UPI002AAADC6F|nr:glycosyltransferase family 39 protein [uncultured Methanolobus sp.]
MTKKNKNPSKSGSYFNYRGIDLFIPLIFILAMINPIRAVLSQYYLLSYQDDIMWVYWVSENIGHPLSLLTHGPGSGYRVTVNLLFSLGYLLWGANASGFYLLNGLLFAGSMAFLYLLTKSLADRLSALIAVLLYLFLDSSFILVWKFNFLTFTSELFFITSSLYFLIQYFKYGVQKNLYFGIILSIFAFFSKEPSIVIIPTVNLIYLYHNWNVSPLSNKTKKLLILINIIPLFALALVMLNVQNAFAPSNSGSLLELIKERLLFYIPQELSWQISNLYLIILSCLGPFYFYAFNREEYYGKPTDLIKKIFFIVAFVILFFLFQIIDINSMSSVIIFLLLLLFAFIMGNMNHRVGIAWFIMALVPLLATSLKVQPTYLAEPNLGFVIFIGVSVASYIKYILSSISSDKHRSSRRDKNKYGPFLTKIILLIIVFTLVVQVLAVPSRLSNTTSYQNTVSDRQTSFKESIDYIVNEVPDGATLYYIPDEKRKAIGGGQINALNLYQLLSLEGRSDLNIESLDIYDPNSESPDNERFVVLPSSLDIYILQTQYPDLLEVIKNSETKIITNGDATAAIVKL